MMKKGFFICIEGVDKSGKTSQSILLVEALSRKGYDVIYTTEPSEGEIGRFIRRRVLSRKERVPAVLETFLFAADRFDHTENQIKPMLKEGKIVVCDRYIHSSMAYQGASGLDLDWIRRINMYALEPDLAIYLNVPIDIVIKRYGKNKSVMEWPEIQRKVQEVYLQFVGNGEMVMIDGNKPIEETAKDIRNLVFQKINH